MAGRSGFRGKLRELHGDDVEILVRPVPSRPSPPNRPSAGAGVLALLALPPMLIIGACLLVVGLAAAGVFVLVLQAMAHTLFG